MQQNIEKNIFVFEKISSDMVALNCLCEADNACHGLSMC